MLAFCRDVHSRTNPKGLPHINRVKAFCKAFFRGGDPLIKLACDNVLNSIHNLDSATIFQTLAQAVETQAKIDELQNTTELQYDSIRVTMSSHHTEVIQTISHLATFTKKDHDLVKEFVQEMAVARMVGIERDFAKKDTVISTRSTEFEAFKALTKSLSTGAETYVTRHLSKLKQIHIPGIFGWIEQKAPYRELCARTQRTLYVSGDSGMGKSFFAYSIYLKLRAEICPASSVAVAYFVFDRAIEELQKAKNMWKFCALQVAQQNPRYQRYLRDLIENDGGSEQGWGELFGIETANLKVKTETQSNMSLKEIFIVIDGVDQMEQRERDSLMGLVRSEKNPLSTTLKTHFVLVGSTKSFLSYDTGKQLILLDKMNLRQSGSFGVLTQHRLSSPQFQALAKLGHSLKWRILISIESNADTFFYIDHMLRRLDALGTKDLIQMEISNPPKSKDEIYKSILEECAQAYNTETQETLGYLIIWLAYSKVPLGLKAAQKLLDKMAALAPSGASINLKDEIGKMMSKILAISDPDCEEPDNIYSGQYREDFIINFQESHLHEYFRIGNDGLSEPLRPSALMGRSMLLKMSLAVLAEEIEDISPSELKKMQAFAAKSWHSTVSEILELLNDGASGGPFVKSVSEYLLEFLQAKSGGVEILENLQDTPPKPSDLERFSILGEEEDDQVRLLEEIVALINKAASSDDEAAAITSVSIATYIAKSHTRNFLTAKDPAAACKSSRFAIQALYILGTFEPRTFNNYTELSDAFLEYEAATEDSRTCKLLEEVIRFEGSQLEPRTYGQISMALFRNSKRGSYREDIVAAEKGLEITTTPGERLFLRYRVAASYLALLNLHDCGYGYCGARLRDMWEAITTESGQRNLKRAREYCAEAVEAAQAISDKAEDYSELKPTINLVFQMMAFVEIQLEEHRGNFLSTMGLAESASSPDTRRHYLNEIIHVLGKMKQWDAILELTKIVDNPLVDPVYGILSPLAYDYIRGAARRCEGVDHIREVYRKADFEQIGQDRRNSTIAFIALQHGSFELFVGMELDKAKQRLERVLDSKYDNFWLRLAIVRLSNIALRNFDYAETFEEKEVAMIEAERVVQKYQRLQGFEFKLELSLIAIPLASMRKKLGPARDFYTALNKCFDACIEALSDDSPSNDSDSLVMLARVICLVVDDPTDREGSRGQYKKQNDRGGEVIDEWFSREDDDEDWEDAKNKGDEEGKHRNNDDDIGGDEEAEENEEAEDTEEAENDEEAEEEDDEENEEDEKNDSPGEVTPLLAISENGTNKQENYLRELWKDAQLALSCSYYTVTESGRYYDSDYFQMCDICSEEIKDVSSTLKAYICLTCINMDICAGCYEEREDDSWICPKSHKYLEYPPDDFKGVEECRLVFEDKEVEFATWRDGLRQKWEASWKHYCSTYWSL
ncbi:hypothetical protein AOL_s00110g227 [Orbilia oligospora ATCC 24927]|uniref:Nephrocystin 3-like N-terminal domain-containing protein n=1 Tax=Arthrobotrys oligospora (strain ATCC 24927 / CBS 115.81 / DSM 1491) TaxID=756982 RepID=G1XL57_ARTOA|nr:hypothetical protein AOL_s00110g227 [Orbilia oligospora ATCC 24927]EGX46063.1 hypothetical protein AOL_s00110g227 [Orbilia oligospora ATCC 24927]